MSFTLYGINGLNLLMQGGTIYSAENCCSCCTAPIPDTCPPGLNTSYCVTIPAGTETSGTGDVYAWAKQSVTVTGGTDCGWETFTGFNYTINGVANPPGSSAIVGLSLNPTSWWDVGLQITLNVASDVVLDWISRNCDNPVGASPYYGNTGILPFAAGIATVTDGACP